MRIIGETKIDFINKRNISFLISLILIIAGIVSLVVKGGPALGIDFAGGALIQLQFSKPVGIQPVREALKNSNFSNASIQRFPDENVIVITVKESGISEEKVAKQIKKIITNALPDNSFIVERNEIVAPVISKKLIEKALLAIIFSSLGILIYVTLRFKGGIWGLAGVIALIHDVFITIGVFSFFNKEITLPVVAALLTLAGYSINDTIVIYDRIREDLKLRKGEKLSQIFDYSINKVLSRTIITGTTTLFVVGALFFKGGEVIHDFSFALLVGIIVGTYSSIFVASPLVYGRMIKDRRFAKMSG